MRSERARLAIAGLTILRAFFTAGCPDAGLTGWGSFEEWSTLIRGTIVFAGQPDPWQSRETVREVDRSAELVRLLHAGLEEADTEGDGVTTSDVERLLSHPVDPDSVDQWPVLRAAMTELCGERVTSKRVGYGLRPYRGRVCAGKRLAARSGHGGVKRWFIESIEKKPTMVAVHSEEPSGCGGLSADVDIPPAGGDGRDGGDESRRIGKSDAKFSHPTGVTYEL